MATNERAILNSDDEKNIFKFVKGVFVYIDKAKELVHLYGNNKELLGIEKNKTVISLNNIKKYLKGKNLDLFYTLTCNDNEDYRNIQINFKNNKKNEKWIDIHGKVIKEDDIVSGFEGYLTDITYTIDGSEKIVNKKIIDEITGLNNSIYLKSKIENFFANNDNNKEQKSALIILGLDNFKYINDSFGKKYSDLFLKTISQKLREIIDNEFICKFSDDEFLIFLKNVESINEVDNKAKELIDIFNNVYDLDGKHIYVSTNIGVALSLQNNNSFDKLLKNADYAMCIAKKSGKNRYEIFNDDISKELDKAYLIERNLSTALYNNEIFIVFQPKVILSNNKVNGFEALIRWKSRELGFVSPVEFIPIAEETGMIIPIGKFVLREVFKKIRYLLDNGYDNFKIAYNISEIQLREGSIIDVFENLSKEFDIDGKYIEIEITESTIIQSFHRNIKALMKLKKFGVTVTLDDFGTGYSSLNHLTKLPIDVLKIDRSFVVDMIENHKSKWVIENIIELSHKLGIEVVAEGVEIIEQVQYLKNIYCDTVQGYFYSKPDMFENVAMLLEK